ncbi:MAG: EthD family reductase [Gammaproteobacteria bacterium]|nr:EthD family reductase [Gammaproteobacteria bacterium]MXW44892.1 EthD family reductase [Gammaproteobacteria bacterium]MYD02928.1 EthD family reductase [Gammaproteobacteria bacterium]MYI26019.1 EthD family reductase [Gammaproteobacteria bacterium]
MHKLLVTYTRPRDIDAFEKHFGEVHAPLVRRIPGLKKLVINRISGNALGGPPSLYLLVGLQFGPKEDYEAAMRSKEQAAAAKDAAALCRTTGSHSEVLTAHEE